jgi:hypothetical protein
VLSFRLNGHHLAQRLHVRTLAEAATCGVEHTPPSAGLVALHARVQGLTPDRFRRAVEVDAFRSTPASARAAIIEEANRLAPLRGAEAVSVKFSR